MRSILRFFCKYGPHDGLLRPKLVANNNNNNNNNKRIIVSDGVHILIYFINVPFFTLAKLINLAKYVALRTTYSLYRIRRHV